MIFSPFYLFLGWKSWILLKTAGKTLALIPSLHWASSFSPSCWSQECVHGHLQCGTQSRFYSQWKCRIHVTPRPPVVDFCMKITLCAQTHVSAETPEHHLSWFNGFLLPEEDPQIKELPGITDVCVASRGKYSILLSRAGFQQRLPVARVQIGSSSGLVSMQHPGLGTFSFLLLPYEGRLPCQFTERHWS